MWTIDAFVKCIVSDAGLSLVGVVIVIVTVLVAARCLLRKAQRDDDLFNR